MELFKTVISTDIKTISDFYTSGILRIDTFNVSPNIKCYVAKKRMHDLSKANTIEVCKEIVANELNCSEETVIKYYYKRPDIKLLQIT